MTKDKDENKDKTLRAGYMVTGNVKFKKKWYRHGDGLQLSQEEYAKFPDVFRTYLLKLTKEDQGGK